MKAPWYIKSENKGSAFRVHWLFRYALIIAFMLGWIWGTFIWRMTLVLSTI